MCLTVYGFVSVSVSLSVPVFVFVPLSVTGSVSCASSPYAETWSEALSITGFLHHAGKLYKLNALVLRLVEYDVPALPVGRFAAATAAAAAAATAAAAAAEAAVVDVCLCACLFVCLCQCL